MSNRNKDGETKDVLFRELVVLAVRYERLAMDFRALAAVVAREKPERQQVLRRALVQMGLFD